MKKIYIALILFVLMFFSNSVVIKAEGEFNTDFNVNYKVIDNGITSVSNQITLTNSFSNIYATSYSLVLEGIDPISVKAYADGGTVYNANISTEGKSTTIKIDFPDAVVGKDKSRKFWVLYDTGGFAKKTGEVWEISIPRLAIENKFDSYYINLAVPETLGDLAYISPGPRTSLKVDGYNNYKFNKEDVTQSGIVAGFGQFQVFSFNLIYHLENPLAVGADTEIAIPPDTSFQKMYYQDINPKPKEFYIDEDGNWIARYSLKTRERLDVIASGSVQIFATQRPYLAPSSQSINNNLLSQEFWQSDSEKIKNLAQELITPQAIYNYVSTNLSYDYERVKPNVERLGALGALSSPKNAICMEFTDLFIALSRAAGIPAREVNGYAYTENPDIQPLSLVNDVLHAWPEYYDEGKQSWIPVDPTWGSTTGGVDFFNKLDLRHFTFVIHGKDSSKPYAAGSYKLGSNPQKDVFVSFGKLPDTRNNLPRISASFGKWIPFFENKLKVEIVNPGPIAIYNLKPSIYHDNKLAEAVNEGFEALLPFQTLKTEYNIPFSFLGAKTPEIVTVVLEGQRVNVLTNKNQVIIYNLLIIFIIVIFITVFAFIKLKRLTFVKILTKWKVKLPASKDMV